MVRPLHQLVLVLALMTTSGVRALAQCADGSPPPCRAAPRAPAAPAPNTIAVLYFDNLSRDTADVYLADGLTEDLINRLTQIEKLQVKSRTAVSRLRGRPDRDPADVGRTLGVSQLLSGSVQRAGSRVRVNVELTRASSGNSVWGRSFDRPADDLLGVQAEIAESIAVHVAGRLAPAERKRFAEQPTRNPRAYDHFMRGRFYASTRTVDGIRNAVREFQQAARLDSTMLGAHLGLALTYGNLASLYYRPDIGISRDSLDVLSTAALARAAKLDSLSPDVALARAQRTDAAQSIGWLDSAVARAPRSATARYSFGLALRSLGLYDDAYAQFEKTIALEPDRPMAILGLAQTRLLQRRPREALAWIDSAIGGFRPDAYFYYGDQGFLRLQLGDTAGARASAEATGRHTDGAGTREVILAMIDARAGDTASARRRMTVVESLLARADCQLTHACLELAWGWAAAGDRDRAIATFERITPRGSWLAIWSDRPQFDPLRSDPRFVRIVEESRATRTQLLRQSGNADPKRFVP